MSLLVKALKRIQEAGAENERKREVQLRKNEKILSELKNKPTKYLVDLVKQEGFFSAGYYHKQIAKKVLKSRGVNV